MVMVDDPLPADVAGEEEQHDVGRDVGGLPAGVRGARHLHGQGQFGLTITITITITNYNHVAILTTTTPTSIYIATHFICLCST